MEGVTKGMISKAAIELLFKIQEQRIYPGIPLKYRRK